VDLGRPEEATSHTGQGSLHASVDRSGNNLSLYEMSVETLNIMKWKPLK
jgi:hypothetical protein